MSGAITSRRPRGNASRLIAWAKRHTPDGSYRLVTDGLHDQTIINIWPSNSRDYGRDWAEEVLAIAQSDADARGSLTQYALQWLDGDGRVRASYVIRCRPEEESVVEGPSVEGIISQQLRHTEAMARMLAQVVQQTSDHQTRLLETMAGRLEALERERQQALEIQAEAIRTIAETEAAQAASDADTKRLERLEQLAMMVGQKLLAQPQGNGKKLPKTHRSAEKKN